jgi:prevent-host-death family protein
VTTITATEARNHLPEALNQVAYGGERVVIERRGKVIGALISKRDLDLLERLEDRYWAEIAHEALDEMNAAGEKPIPWEKVKADLGL